MAGGALAQLTASKAGSSGTVRNWHPLAGGADVNAGEYYGGSSQRYFPAGSNKLKVPCHAYGQGRASSFGSVHDDWKSAGPNLAPYPGSSGMMTGGAKRKGRKQTKKSGSKKIVKVQKTKRAAKRGGGGELMLNFNGKVITLTKSYFDTDEGKIFLENLKNTSSNPNFKNTNSKNTIKVKVDTYTQIENAIYKLLESINNTIDIPQINIPTEEIFKELEMLKNKLYCFTIQYIDPNPGQENKSLTKENQEELKPTSLPHKLSICTDNIKKLQTYYSVLSKKKQKYLSRVNTFKKMNNDDNLERAQALYQLHADILDNVKPVLKREDSNTHSMNDYELYSRVARPLWDILES